MAVFTPFSPLSSSPEGEIFADFRKNAAKIEFREPEISVKKCGFYYILLIFRILYFFTLFICLIIRYININNMNIVLLT